ncbi:MAG: sugar phosphate isomerase/epimerase family protein [Chloroflexota bacterium]
MLSITTDFSKDKGNPEPYLRQIAEAGFSHIHWCHHWNTDFLYADSEINQIQSWLKEYGLALQDLHASEGMEKYWLSEQEYARLAGVELVKNRIAMTARLGGDVVVMHVPNQPDPLDLKEQFWSRLEQSLDALEPFARQHQVRIAIENLITNFDTLDELLRKYNADFLGICYDSGHANINGDRMERLNAVKDRLICLHLHDNDGRGDQHKPLFTGTVNWPRLSEIIATSSYDKVVSMEVSIHNSGITDEKLFLGTAYDTGTTFARMIEDSK